MRLAAILLALGLSTACGTPFDLERDESAAIQTDRLRYEPRRVEGGFEIDIGFTFTNRTDAAAFVVNCGGASEIVLEKLVEGEWILAWRPILPLCLSPPIVILVGETFSTTLHVFGGDPDCRCAPQFTVDEVEGLYRLVWEALLRSFDENSFPFGESLPLEQRISNQFSIERP